MTLLSSLTDKGLGKVLGSGPTGMVAGAGLRWMQKKLTEDKSALVVTKDEIRPGERFVVIARPAPTKLERKLQRHNDKLADALAAMKRPSRRRVKVARRINATQKRRARLDKFADRTGRRANRKQRRSAQLDTRIDKLWVAYDRADRHAAKRAKVQAIFDDVAAQLAAEKARAMAAAGARPTRRATFRHQQ